MNKVSRMITDNEYQDLILTSKLWDVVRENYSLTITRDDYSYVLIINDKFCEEYNYLPINKDLYYDLLEKREEWNIDVKGEDC